jgi:hypothetical protein
MFYNEAGANWPVPDDEGPTMGFCGVIIIMLKHVKALKQCKYLRG